MVALQRNGAKRGYATRLIASFFRERGLFLFLEKHKEATLRN